LPKFIAGKYPFVCNGNTDSFFDLTGDFILQCKSLTRRHVMDLITIRKIKCLDISFVESVEDESFVEGFKEHRETFSFPSIAHSLQNLSLSQCGISDRALHHFGNFKSLTNLGLRWNLGITDSGIEAISKVCPVLSNLDVTSCPITDLSLLCITENCLFLTELNISWCTGVSDKGIIYMVSGANHEKLDILRTLRATWCTALTDASLRELVNLKSLRVFEALGYSMQRECKAHLESSGVSVLL
jgi:hypothetical protein